MTTLHSCSFYVHESWSFNGLSHVQHKYLSFLIVKYMIDVQKNVHVDLQLLHGQQAKISKYVHSRFTILRNGMEDGMQHDYFMRLGE